MWFLEGISHVSGHISHMARGLIQEGTNAVEPITIVPLLSRVGRLDMALIKPNIDWGVQVMSPRAPLCLELHLIMRVHIAGIEGNGIP